MLVSINTAGWRSIVRLEWSVLTKNTMLCPWPGLELGPLHLETSALTMRPPHLPHRLQDVNNQMERLNTTAIRAGLKIHPGKTKVINAVIQEEVCLNQPYIEEFEDQRNRWWHNSLKKKSTVSFSCTQLSSEKQSPMDCCQNQNFQHQHKGSFVVQLTDMEGDNNISKESTNFYRRVSEDREF